jgi:hypothetical protein
MWSRERDAIVDFIYKLKLPILFPPSISLINSTSSQIPILRESSAIPSVKMFKQALLALAASTLLGSAVTVPVEASVAAATARASNAGFYLINCSSSAVWSETGYYANARFGAQNGQKPDHISVADSGGYITWEGTKICSFFQDSGDSSASSSRRTPKPVAAAAITAGRISTASRTTIASCTLAITSGA